jgi:response regulator RpfG family c-di-GMP phosphodiesterase
MKNKITLGVADDEQFIHENMDIVIKRKLPETDVEHFYDTSNLKDFLYECPLGLDLLLLDVHFNGGETGIEALPKIREYSPGLPIILLTGEKNPDIIELAYPYKIEYLAKPVDENTLVIRINAALHNKSEAKELIHKLDDTSPLREEMKNQISALKQVTMEYNELRKEYESLANQFVSAELSELISKIFVDVEFSSRALCNFCSCCDDERIIRVLKTIDWQKKPTGGMRAKLWEKSANGDTWYFRFSKKGRIFVSFPKGSKPVIEKIDFKHKHSK